jgi:hypothetical protein
MSYREDSLIPMDATQSNRSHNVQNDDKQDMPRRPYGPWALVGLAVTVGGLAIAGATGQSGLFSFLIFAIVVLLVLGYVLARGMGRMRRGWKRLTDRA